SGINFTMAIPAGFTVRGRVTGLPNQSAARIVMTGSPNPTQDTVVAANGSFEFLRVRPGTYTLIFSAFSPGVTGQPVSITVADKDIADIEIVTVPTVSVTGLLAVDGGGPRPRVLLSFAPFKGATIPIPGGVFSANGEFRAQVP